MTGVHAAWLPVEAFRPLGSRRTVVYGQGLLVATVLDEVATACAVHGGTVRHAGIGWDGTADSDLVLAVANGSGDPEGFQLARRDGVTTLVADTPAGLLYGLYHLVRLGEAAFGPDRP